MQQARDADDLRQALCVQHSLKCLVVNKKGLMPGVVLTQWCALQQARSNSDVAMVSPMALSPRSSDSSPVPPTSAFQAGVPPQPPNLEQALAEAAAGSAGLSSVPR